MTMENILEFNELHSHHNLLPSFRPIPSFLRVSSMIFNHSTGMMASLPLVKWLPPISNWVTLVFGTSTILLD